jgi:hypothetical protein
LSESELDTIDSIDFNDICDNRIDFIDNYGVFKGEQTDILYHMDINSDFALSLTNKFKDIEELKSHTIDGVCVHTHLRPYDTHADLITSQNGVPVVDHTIHKPSYTVLIPLSEDPLNGTVIFDQIATESNAFMDYKSSHSPLDVCVDNDTWERYCGHCHADDQQYLTIKDIINWHRGDSIVFHRTLFHAGVNFKTAKKSIIIRLSYPQ